MGKTDAVRLQHMIDAAPKIVTFVEGRNRKDLDQDEMLSLAVVRLLEILGEAAKNVSEATTTKASSIPWRQICGTRDRLIHAYFEVNLDIVWEIATKDLPPIIPQLKVLLDEVEGDGLKS